MPRVWRRRAIRGRTRGSRVLPVIRKRIFLTFGRGWGRRRHHPRGGRDPPSIIRIQNIPAKNCIVALEGGGEPPPFEAAGFWPGNLREKATIKAGSTLS